MARSKRVPHAEPANWKPHEENELLAWLDYNLQKSSDGFEAFRQSVSAHLRRECNVSYTYEQCRRKLYLSWLRYGDESAKKVAVLHEHGSETLTHLPTEQKDFILARAMELRERDLNFPRRLRSVSRNSATPSQHHGDNRRPTSTRGQLPHLRVPSVVISTARISKAKRPLSQHSKRGRLSNKFPVSDLSREGEEDGEAKSNKEKDPVHTGTTDKTDKTPDADDITMAGVPSAKNGSDQTTATNPWTAGALETLKSELAALKEQVRVLGELQNETRSFMVFLHMRLGEAVERDEVAKARIHSLERAERARADGKSLVLEVANLEDRIAYLQRKVDKARELGKFTQLSSTGVIRPWSLRWVDKTMDDIDFYMEQLLLDHDNIDHFEPPNLDDGADLAALVRTILGLTPQERLSTEKVRIQLSKLSLQSVVRALTAATLCEWVFEAELPDGAVALQNLDFAAHQSLFEGTLFQDNILPRQAESLACRLSKVLSRIFRNDDSIVVHSAGSYGVPSVHRFYTWGVDERIWMSTRDKMIKIFALALEIKYKFMLSTYQFEAVLYPPRTPFRAEQMKPETVQGSEMTTNASTMHGIEVKLCLLPSLYFWRSDCMRVNCKTFVQRLPSDRQECERLTQAVVVAGQS
ncbi:uncharacterized protein CDV56_106246 [Aspergillus thermomutatus]|uniref:Uncharacterized protein n=1 Tax=Aspergillus thermomutatus TaxID=41047 RepID=A0A397GLP6_ASPTH|nr:uncharacterized protein CDV56_106246 [Aspergillus thermomutatus]RHZ51805.1 hypothetical protein CDV56_106246 [Aspergillus thermomutatus]